jgi:transposase
VKDENKYYRRSKISEWKFRSLVLYFAHDLSATETAQLTGLTRKSVTSIFLRLRQRIAQECKRSSPLSAGKIRLAEEHSCTRCVCGRRACGVNHGKPVFSLLKFDNHIYISIIPDCKKALLRAIIRGRAVEDAVLRNNGWHGYDALIDVEYERPYLVDKPFISEDLYAVNEVDHFWSFARGRLEKFNGIPNRTFYLHLKECEWRYNMRRHDLYGELLEVLERHPL